MLLSEAAGRLPANDPEQRQPEYILVEKPEDLPEIAARIEKEKSAGVDLEADSMFHYREKVCLLQISTPKANFLFDPLSLQDLSPLAPFFADSNIRKVFHGADYDIRSLQRDFGIEVGSLFDTQIAARFLGVTETGLASLLKHQLGVLIGKKYQKKDWSKRPLPEAMLSYAVRDACYLLPLSEMLVKQLRAKGRVAWVEEECEVLSKVSPAPPNKGPFFLKFKGARKLDSQSLAVLESILRLRDKVARDRDLPHFKVLRSGPIMEMAEKKPAAKRDLKRIRGMSVKQVEVLGDPLLKAINQALSLPKASLPSFPKETSQHVSPNVRKQGKAIKKWREQAARKLGLEPSLLLTNTQIHSVARERPLDPKALDGVEGIRSWQKQLFGKEICDLLKSLD